MWDSSETGHKPVRVICATLLFVNYIAFFVSFSIFFLAHSMTSNFPFASFCKQYLAVGHCRVSAHNWRVRCLFIHLFTHLHHFLLEIFFFFAVFSFALFPFVNYFCTFVSAFF